MNIKLIIGGIFVMFLFSGCNNLNKNSDNTGFKAVELKYAKGFGISKNADTVKLTVKNPWQHAKNIRFEYLLSKSIASGANTIKVPVNKVVCLSSTHVAFLSKLNKQASIAGVTNSKFIYDSIVSERIKSNKTIDVGNEQALNYEAILNLKPDVIFAYGVGAEVQSVYQKFADWNIPVVIVAEYLEATPLGKAEWIKFFSCFFNDYSLADSLFSIIDSEYNNYALKVKNIQKKPVVMLNLPWRGVWYMPGGKSFMSDFINDAGGKYIYNSDTSRESMSLSIEQVVADCKNVDIWINAGMANSLSDIENTDTRIVKLNPFISKQVYNNNKRVNLAGGNDFWGSGVICPQDVLKDLIKIFHPEIFNDTNLVYYKKLY